MGVIRVNSRLDAAPADMPPMVCCRMALLVSWRQFRLFIMELNMFAMTIFMRQAQKKLRNSAIRIKTSASTAMRTPTGSADSCLLLFI